jgi:hypothetical protein
MNEQQQPQNPQAQEARGLYQQLLDALRTNMPVGEEDDESDEDEFDWENDNELF